MGGCVGAGMDVLERGGEGEGEKGNMSRRKGSDEALKE